MGRPLQKDVYGTYIVGLNAPGVGISFEGFFGGELNNDFFIVKQRGAKTFVVTRQSAPTVHYTGVLVEGEPAVNGEIRIVGDVVADGTTESIQKFTKRTARGFQGNLYKWKLEPKADPEIGNTITLTAI